GEGRDRHGHRQREATRRRARRGGRACRWSASARSCGPGGPDRRNRRTAQHRADAGRERQTPRRASVRVLIADDEALLREGLARLLTEAGVDVVGTAGTADELLRAVKRDRPDVAIVDIRMPPTHRDEGLVAAQEIRGTSDVGVLVLSHYLEA